MRGLPWISCLSALAFGSPETPLNSTTDGRHISAKVTVTPTSFFATSPPMDSCSLGVANVLKRSLGIPLEYPDDRLIAKLKDNLVSNLMSRATIGPVGRKRAAARNSSSEQPGKDLMGVETNNTNWLSADLRIGRFLNSPLVDAIVSLLVSNITLTPGVVAKVTLDSPMVNIGKAMCAGAGYSFLRDETRDVEDTCALMSSISVLTCGTATGPTCRKSKSTTSHWISGFSACPLKGEEVDSHPTDTELDIAPNTDMNNKTQGYVDYWLYRAVQTVAQYTASAFCLDREHSDLKQVIPGWTSIFEIWTTAEGSELTQNSLPLTVVASHDTKPCEVLVVTRGSSSDYEWAKDFTVTLSPARHGEAHTGALSVTNAVYPPLKDFLDVHFEKHSCRTEQAKVLVTGHSLGGSLAILLALFIAEDFDDPPSVQTHLVTFAALHTLDEVGEKKLNELVASSRNWISEFDPVAYLPCSTTVGLPRCNPQISAVAFGVGRDVYANHRNVMKIERSMLSQYGTQFGHDTFGTIEFSLLSGGALSLNDLTMAAPLDVTAYHTCAYGCFLDANYCGTDRAVNTSRCLYCNI